MSLLNDIVKAAVQGLHIPFTVTDWEGSVNGHRHSLAVDAAAFSLDGAKLAAAFHFTIADGFENAGPHAVSGEMTLPHANPIVGLDGERVPDGRIALLGHTKLEKPRVEIVFYCPLLGDPLRHFRFDGVVRSARK